MAQTELPDLILMDIRLPGGIDGLEATRRIKALAWAIRLCLSVYE